MKETTNGMAFAFLFEFPEKNEQERYTKIYIR